MSMQQAELEARLIEAGFKGAFVREFVSTLCKLGRKHDRLLVRRLEGAEVETQILRAKGDIAALLADHREVIVRHYYIEDVRGASLRIQLKGGASNSFFGGICVP